MKEKSEKEAIETAFRKLLIFAAGIPVGAALYETTKDNREKIKITVSDFTREKDDPRFIAMLKETFDHPDVAIPYISGQKWNEAPERVEKPLGVKESFLEVEMRTVSLEKISHAKVVLGGRAVESMIETHFSEERTGDKRTEEDTIGVLKAAAERMGVDKKLVVIGGIGKGRGRTN